MPRSLFTFLFMIGMIIGIGQGGTGYPDRKIPGNQYQ